VYADVEQINYDTSIHALEEKQTLYIYDLPANLAQLKAIIKQTKPVNIVACYHIEDSAYLSAFPSREEFVWFYALVRK
ncbi:single-stranded-DNA-specific exonuclease C-terminal domain-containing protein, partial [Staphylococcus sp. SIMBA_130]